MKEFFKKPLNFIILITCLVIITYFGIKIYKEIIPLSHKEQQMQCLKLGSDSRAAACLKLLDKQ